MEALYARFHRREFVRPDPLQVLYAYPDLRRREAVALVAASLAFGRVTQIVRNVETVVAKMEDTGYLRRPVAQRTLTAALAPFRHRWVTGEEVAALLLGAQKLQAQHGSLLNCFRKGAQAGDATLAPGLIAFARELSRAAGGGCPSLVSSPADGSACKRMFLFLRWMVRKDGVDPGGWETLGAQRLIVPLDVHIHRICRMLEMTDRRHATLRTAVEITEAFRSVSPEDPVKYDFALSRLGLRRDADPKEFFAQCGMKEARS
jgi:uncharacterized protein (TIGR02757 family)